MNMQRNTYSMKILTRYKRSVQTSVLSRMVSPKLQLSFLRHSTKSVLVKKAESVKYSIHELMSLTERHLRFVVFCLSHQSVRFLTISSLTDN